MRKAQKNVYFGFIGPMNTAVFHRSGDNGTHLALSQSAVFFISLNVAPDFFLKTTYAGGNTWIRMMSSLSQRFGARSALTAVNSKT
jgi:hypothetical protein